MILNIIDTSTTIVAPATAAGGAVMVTRLSGSRAIEIADKIFRGRKPLAECEGYTLHYGTIRNEQSEVIDDVVVALFRAPNSYTGDDTVEITTHGSEHICSELLRLAIGFGATMATPGEFTRRAFLAGKMDLSRAEAVADIISSDSSWAHTIASTQMRGGYSAKLAEMRGELLRLCSLLELELDFSEEDVEFADRTLLKSIITDVEYQVSALLTSFSTGNAIKNGVNVAIVGEPNVGKSTLLNALVEDDRAMVSDVAGTTRDTIEATTIIDGIRFRFVDTAGIHDTANELEKMGIERTHRAIEKAYIILHLTSAENPEFKDIERNADQHYIQVVNKIDKNIDVDRSSADTTLYISAKQNIGIDELRCRLRSTVDTSSLNANSVVVSNMRHYAALRAAHEALLSAHAAIESNMPSDLISEDIRQVLHHLGEITGEITSDDILHSIFSKFCIGK